MARLGLGRTPVREAVQRLHSRRLRDDPAAPRDARLRDQHHRPRRHLRGPHAPRVLGVAAGRRAGAARRTAREAAQLHRRRSTRLGADGLRDAAADLDRRIHRFVYRCAKNPFLAETLDHYHNLSLRILHVAMKRYPALTPRLDDVVHEQRTAAGGDRPRRRRHRRARRRRAHLDVRARDPRADLSDGACVRLTLRWCRSRSEPTSRASGRARAAWRASSATSQRVAAHARGALRRLTPPAPPSAPPSPRAAERR